MPLGCRRQTLLRVYPHPAKKVPQQACALWPKDTADRLDPVVESRIIDDCKQGPHCTRLRIRTTIY
jgi:hypothetical protein